MYLRQNDLFEPYQSAYRRFHSTETALIKIKDDIITSIGSRKAVLLLLIDLSSAFDTIDHIRLLNILEAIGISGYVLDWIRSYLTGRSQSIICGDAMSSSFDLNTGVPQGSVLGLSCLLPTFHLWVRHLPTLVLNTISMRTTHKST
jgi:hypothetical protein